ncbi:MAG: hypothetical protein ACTHKJ_06570, partial [Candidatus Nitrosocosmicus sp.]
PFHPDGKVILSPLVLSKYVPSTGFKEEVAPACGMPLVLFTVCPNPAGVSDGNIINNNKNDSDKTIPKTKVNLSIDMLYMNTKTKVIKSLLKTL